MTRSNVIRALLVAVGVYRCLVQRRLLRDLEARRVVTVLSVAKPTFVDFGPQHATIGPYLGN